MYIYLYLFYWYEVSQKLNVILGSEGFLCFNIFGYELSLQCELVGFVDYMEKWFLFFGKMVEMVLWSGDIMFIEEVLEVV